MNSYFQFLNIKLELIHRRHFGCVLLGVHQDNLDFGRLFYSLCFAVL